ncbi:MAG: hypothetical protein NTY10_02340 [Candidatus Omnitrophica bacterium]|nr:hypothetical protein [Candidatus Omnitrophota bacterium]
MAIKRIDIIHHSHFDYGYTDHQAVCREIQNRYLDVALDAALATMHKRPEEKFRWTAEALFSVYEWWKEASGQRRKSFLKAIGSGQIEVTGFPFSVTTFLTETQWALMLNWVPEELWKKFRIQSVMHCDPNGIPLAGIIEAAKKGVRYLWMGPNDYLGRTPFKKPTAFNWKLPDGKTVFVWINNCYCDAHYLFNENWRQGPVPAYSDLKYRNPEKGDIFSTEKKEMLKAHRRCLERIRILESGEEGAIPGVGNTHPKRTNGYKFERLVISMTNQWRMDNDPPFPPLIDFVAKWNEMGLEPQLRLTTTSAALKEMEAETVGQIPEVRGEWVDWWANGIASAPQELSASRKAKRNLAICRSEIFGRLVNAEHKELRKIEKELCLFDEHNFCSWASVAYPYRVDSLGQLHEKSAFAYRALALSEMVLSDKIKKIIKKKRPGIYAANPSKLPFSGWIELPADALRDRYTHVKDKETGETGSLFYEPGPQDFVTPSGPESFTRENDARTFSDHVPEMKARFWSGVIPPCSIKRYSLLKSGDKNVSGGRQFISFSENGRKLDIKTDCVGWPESVKYNKGSVQLFAQGFGDFISLSPKKHFAPRSVFREIHATEEGWTEKRNRLLFEEGSTYQKAREQDEGPTVFFEQFFTHPFLRWGVRKLRIWKDQPRANLVVTINRRSSLDPQVLYCQFPFPCKGEVPFLSNGGHEFKPGQGQIPGTCMDYYAIDGGVRYSSEKGNWLWSSVDAGLVTFEKPNAFARLVKLPAKTEVLLSMIFDNTWDTNFFADSHGVMEFNYDLLWKPDADYNFTTKEITDVISGRTIVAVSV